MTLWRAMACGLALGVSFSVAAALADLVAQRRLPHPHIYADLSEYLTATRTQPPHVAAC